MSMESLKAAIIEEMEAGYRPTTRGHEWGRVQFSDLEAAALAIQLAFDLMKAVQYPEVRYSRIADAALVLEQLDGSQRESGDGHDSSGQFLPSDEVGKALQDVFDI